jgi:hypothetical protein
LELGETDEGKLRARQKQINIGCKTEGYRRLKAQGLSGRALQDALGLPYMTEDGTLALTLLCSKKRYDGYLRIWKRKLYEFAGLQRLRFSASAPPADACPPSATLTAESSAALTDDKCAAQQARATTTWAARVAAGVAKAEAAPCR